MTCEEALQWIHSTPRFNGPPGLERMRELMARLGDPQNGLGCVHVAGTNGKGSVSAMTASILREAGHRTGLFTSPYLEDFRERIQVNGELISPDGLGETAERVRRAAEGLSMTEFELVTAIGFCWFAQQGCDVVVLEVGLGGRFDATNVIPPPLCAAVTAIGLDHTQVLGHTLEQIAGEKAGILKPGSRAVISPDQPSQAAEVLEAVCRERGIPLRRAVLPDGERNREDLRGSWFDWQGKELYIPLPGKHQIANAATALTVIENLREQGMGISDQTVERGLADTRWPGRLEVLREHPIILLDAAHNPAGVEVLCRHLDAHLSDRRLVTVMGMLADKDHRPSIRAVAGRSGRFFAAPPPSPRALPAEDIAREAAEVCGDVTPCADVPSALALVLAGLGAEDALLVCGSIPLVGEARSFLRKRL